MKREMKFRAWEKEKMNIRKGSKGMYKQNGYILAKADYHPYANKRGYVPLHRLLMENELCRYLIPRKELVHHIDGNRSNNDLVNLKLTTPKEHYMDEHYTGRNPNGRFVCEDSVFEEIKYRLFDKDKNIIQIYTLKELMSKTFRRSKFKFRGRFTGLKDKNGKEIYEGDIVKGKRHSHWHGGWDLVNAKVEFNKDMLMFCAEGVLVTIEELEIVGNIYENPELIDELQ